MNNEIWKPIVGYEGLYEISNYGLVRSLDRIELCGGHIKQRKRNGRNLIRYSDKDGYLFVRLCKLGIVKGHRVHRLVLQAFRPMNKYKLVNHKDGNKTNNYINNLEWCSSFENMQHSYDLGLSHSGSRHYKAKLTEKDVDLIRELCSDGKISKQDIANRFHVSDSTIGDINKGRTWKRYGVVLPY